MNTPRAGQGEHSAAALQFGKKSTAAVLKHLNIPQNIHRKYTDCISGQLERPRRCRNAVSFKRYNDVQFADAAKKRK